MLETIIRASSISNFLQKRWLIIFGGLIIQGIILIMVSASLSQPGLPSDLTFTQVAENPNLCRITSVTPFTDAWINGIQSGMLAYPAKLEGPFEQLRGIGTLSNCKPTAHSIKIQVVSPQSTFILILNTTSQTLNFTNLLLGGILAIIFSSTGITIFLRASDRPVAYTAYGLFYLASIAFWIFTLRSYPWISILLYILSIIIYGMATTFVCLLPHPSRSQRENREFRLSPYTGLVVSIIWSTVSLLIIIWLPQARPAVSIINAIYIVTCMMIVIWMMLWGMRHLAANEKQIIRVIVVGIIFLLLPMALNQKLLPYTSLVVNSPTHFFIPLMILPLICGYALLRHQLLGTTSLLGRQVMRVLLWLLLSSFFILPSINLLRYLEHTIANPEIRGYCYAGVLFFNLWLFPLLWSKVRDVGDHVFYRDFYQYNQSLRELSAELTRMQNLDEICTFLLPQMKKMLNATGVALLVRAQRGSLDNQRTAAASEVLHWHIYYHDIQNPFLPAKQLIGIANLALTHIEPFSNEPLLIDSILLLPLYHGDMLRGFLCLGPKKNFEPCSRQDKSFLATLTAQLSVLEVNSRYLEQAQADAYKMTALNHRVVSAQEDERRHLALELHDEVLQQAMLLVRQLAEASTITDVADVMPLGRSIVSSLRSTCLKLRPPLLDELGLEEALYWLAQQTEQHNDLQVKVFHAGISNQRPSAYLELALYRVVQEALTNVTKHAKASRVIIRLHYGARGRISLLIWDNGRGFRQGQTQSEQLGLAGMHERMAAVGGQLQIRTRPGRGTIIRAVYIPTYTMLRKPEEARR